MMESNYHEFVELDPTGRYGRYNEILGKGASKTVYRAFDEFEAVEVAWNQVKLNDLLRRPEELERLYSEIHLLKTLQHKSIMRFCTSWVDTAGGNINFVTELFTSGTLRQYRQKHKKVHIRAVKHWCRQILKGLLYLHSHDPPIVHRDLKCDNIFINGNQGTVKIGDLGLAVFQWNSHSTHCVGTPEFMAPEVFEEDYNELADIYSFGMCVLEMITFEYPYSECSHPVQIYKKVISGTMPAALYRIQDPEVRQFIEKCLVTASHRPSAKELLKDRFLRVDDQSLEDWDGGISDLCQIRRLHSYYLCSIGSLTTKELANDLTRETKSENMRVYEADMDQILRQHSSNMLDSNGSLITNKFTVDHLHQTKQESSQDPTFPDLEMQGIHLFNDHEKPFHNIAIIVEGTRQEEGSIFLRLRITSQEGHVKNIHFPFDIEFDTALRVAAEMVRELDITGHNVSRIADIIDSEVAAFVSEWKPGLNTNLIDFPATDVCNNPASNDSPHRSHCNIELYARCSGPENCFTEGAPAVSTIQPEVVDISSQGSSDSHSSEEGNQLNQTIDNEQEIQADSQTDRTECVGELHSSSVPELFLQASEVRRECSSTNASDAYENKMSKDSRWADSRDQMELRDDKNQQMDGRSSNASPVLKNNTKPTAENGVRSSSSNAPLQAFREKLRKKFGIGKRFSFSLSNRRNLIPVTKSFNEPSSGYSYSSRADSNRAGSLENMFTAKSFYAGLHLPNSLL